MNGSELLEAHPQLAAARGSSRMGNWLTELIAN